MSRRLVARFFAQEVLTPPHLLNHLKQKNKPARMSTATTTSVVAATPADDPPVAAVGTTGPGVPCGIVVVVGFLAGRVLGCAGLVVCGAAVVMVDTLWCGP